MKKLAFILVILTAFGSKSYSQENLFDETNTRKFADYLLESGQYTFAIKEFERLNYLVPQDQQVRYQLLKSYRLAGLNEEGEQRTYRLFEPLKEMPRIHSLEFSKMLMNQKKWDRAINFWNQSETLPETDKALLESTVHVFNSDFVKARERLATLTDTSNFMLQGYRSIIDRGINSPKKSPLLAGVLSTLIPGLGKAYTGDWKDGIVSLIFTGGMAFQAVRKFNQFGANNYRPWVYTAIGSGFYLGNIYGSVKSAKNKNRKKINQLQHEASDLFNAYY